VAAGLVVAVLRRHHHNLIALARAQGAAEGRTHALAQEVERALAESQERERARAPGRGSRPGRRRRRAGSRPGRDARVGAGRARSRARSDPAVVIVTARPDPGGLARLFASDYPTLAVTDPAAALAHDGGIGCVGHGPRVSLRTG
jgi:hypothetical protein